MNRRQMLIGSALTLGGTAVFARLRYLPAPRREFARRIVMGSTGVPSRITDADPTLKGAVFQYNLESEEIRHIDLPFFPHGFGFMPGSPRAATCVKGGMQAALVDLRSNQLTQLLQAPSDYRFFGHCCFTTDRRNVLFSGANEAEDGAVMVFDAASGQLVKIVAVDRPLHEVRLLDQDHVIIACDGAPKTSPLKDGGAAQILNFNTGAVQKTWEIGHASHILPVEDNKYLFGGSGGLAAGPQLNYVDMNQGLLRKFTAPGGEDALFFGEALSLVRLDPDHALVSFCDSKQVVVWNFRDGRVAHCKLPRSPNGFITLGPRSFLGNFGSGAIGAFRFHPERMEITHDGGLENIGANGRHMYPLFTDQV